MSEPSDHGSTQGSSWQMNVEPIKGGIKIVAHDSATPLYLSIDALQEPLCERATATPAHNWHYGFDLAVERYRGLSVREASALPNREDHLHAATFEVTLKPGESLTLVASSEPQPNLDGVEALKLHYNHEQKLINLWKLALPQNNHSQARPAWIERLVLAADQFIVERPLPDAPNGKTIIAGYPWFGDWGRDAMISLPGLTIATGRTEIARRVMLTFAKYVDKGTLPNRFPDAGDVPEYNTVDATLWYFEAIRSYYDATADNDLLAELFPVLADIIDWHCRGTRYNIHLDARDGLLYAGESGVQLTWMDAKVGDWVVTPRIGKPIEINALWYCALRSISKFARQLGKPYKEYDALAVGEAYRRVRFVG